MTKIEQARELQTEGFNCSQRTLLVFCDELNINRKEALQIASGFGAGMHHGEVCGAIAGAIMVLGLKYGHSEGTDAAAKEKINNTVRQFNTAFIAKHKTLLCKELVGMDFSIRENMEEARKTGIFKTICAEFVDDAIGILEEIIKEANNNAI